jgi:hypothetical protein
VSCCVVLWTLPPPPPPPPLPQEPKACTIVLRGASKDTLNEVERNLQVGGGVLGMAA